MNWKEEIKKLVFPHEFIIFLIFNISVVGLIFVFEKGLEAHWFAYPLYIFSFYVLITVCIRVPGIVNWWKRRFSNVRKDGSVRKREGYVSYFSSRR